MLGANLGLLLYGEVSVMNKTDDIPPQMKILNMVIPILMHFLTFIRQKHIILHQNVSFVSNV